MRKWSLFNNRAFCIKRGARGYAPEAHQAAGSPAVHKELLNEAGQSTVEFVLTLILLMAFVLFYVQLTLVFAFGNYVHYATFMSARAYLSASESAGDQQIRAKDVITRTLKRGATRAGTDRFPFIGKGFGPGDPTGAQIQPPDNFDAANRSLSWLEGVRYSFRSRLFMIPLAGIGDQTDPSVNSVTLTAESWLGREPSYEECNAEMKAIVGGGSAGGGPGTGKQVLFDNGC